MRPSNNIDNGNLDFVQRDDSKAPESPKCFTDHLLDLKGKLVELFIGEAYETMNYDEFSTTQNSSTFGRLIDVFDRFIVIDCLYVDLNGVVRYGNRVYINAFQIRAMTLLNKEGGLEDIFTSNKDANKIRKMLTMSGEPIDTNKY